jgi:hypothetical protein
MCLRWRFALHWNLPFESNHVKSCTLGGATFCQMKVDAINK